MKAPSGNTIKLYAAVILSLAAVGTVTWAVLPHTGPQQAATAQKSGARGALAPAESLDPRLHLDLLANAEQVKYEGKGKNIFRADSEPMKIEQVKISPLLKKQQEMALHQGPPAPPPPPPINLKFFGLVSNKGEKPKAFLSQGDDVWVAHEGDVVNRHYKVVRISNHDVEIEDLLNSHHESIPLSQS